MKYTVYFECYGKKLRTTVTASTEEGAKKIILDHIKFHKVEKLIPGLKEIQEMFKDLTGYKP